MVDANDGTAAGFMEFLRWAEDRFELPKSTTTNWRGASTNVFSLEDDWEQLDLRTLDLDQFLARFETKNRTKYKTDSLNAYKSRFRKAVESYRLWLDGGDWKGGVSKSADGGRRSARTDAGSNGNGSRSSGSSGSSGGARRSSKPDEEDGMIEYPFPLRPGVQARLTLPEALTKKDAQRIAAFVNSLAFDEQLAITAGSDGD